MEWLNYHHLLNFLVVARAAKRCRRRFPKSLDNVPFLLPSGSSTLRRVLDDGFDTSGIRPKVVAELNDAALTKVLGEAGVGVFAALDVVVKDVDATTSGLSAGPPASPQTKLLRHLREAKDPSSRRARNLRSCAQEHFRVTAIVHHGILDRLVLVL